MRSEARRYTRAVEKRTGMSSFLARFQRIMSGGTYVAEVDGLRFVAIMSVFFFHVGRMTEIRVQPYVEPTNRLLALVGWAIFNGDRGVPIFFAISGFILGIPFARERLLGGPKVSIRQYLLRRLTRLEPPYMISQLLRLYPVMVARSLSFAQILPHLLAGLLYIHLLVYGTFPTVQLVGWSLEIEIQFYLLTPLLAAFFFRKSPWTRRALLAGFLVLHSVVIPLVGPALVGDPLLGTPGARFTVNTILYWIRFFVAGMLIADMYVSLMPKLREHWAWDAASLVLWPAAFLMPTFDWMLLGPFLLVVMFVGAFKGRVVPMFFRLPLVTTIGGMCYSLYLTHSIVLQGLYVAYIKVLPGIHGFFPRMFVGEVLIVPWLVIFGAVYFVLIERPCMDKRWPGKLMAWMRSKTGRGNPVAETE